jgi:uncharacterized membrane protein
VHVAASVAGTAEDGTSMNALTGSRHVDAPPERVWPVLTDLEHAPEFVRAIETVEVHTGTGFGLTRPSADSPVNAPADRPKPASDGAAHTGDRRLT